MICLAILGIAAVALTIWGASRAPYDTDLWTGGAGYSNLDRRDGRRP